MGTHIDIQVHMQSYGYTGKSTHTERYSAQEVRWIIFTVTKADNWIDRQTGWSACRQVGLRVDIPVQRQLDGYAGKYKCTQVER